MKKNNQRIIESPQVIAAIVALTSLLVIGTITYRLLEKWSWIDSFYFTVVTLATVGYGDLAPTTGVSKLFTAIFIMVGATVALAALGIIGSRYLEKRENRIKERRRLKD